MLRSLEGVTYKAGMISFSCSRAWLRGTLVVRLCGSFTQGVELPLVPFSPRSGIAFRSVCGIGVEFDSYVGGAPEPPLRLGAGVAGSVGIAGLL